MVNREEEEAKYESLDKTSGWKKRSFGSTDIGVKGRGTIEMGRYTGKTKTLQSTE